MCVRESEREMRKREKVGEKERGESSPKVEHEGFDVEIKLVLERFVHLHLAACR